MLKCLFHCSNNQNNICQAIMQIHKILHTCFSYNSIGDKPLSQPVLSLFTGRWILTRLFPYAGFGCYGEGPHLVCNRNWRTDGSFWRNTISQFHTYKLESENKCIQCYINDLPMFHIICQDLVSHFEVRASFFVWGRRLKGYLLQISTNIAC